MRSHQMASDQDKILVGVSGGIDSMVLLHLLIHTGLSVGVAHCNFSLRGEESDGDEQFVRYYCLMNGIQFHSIRFDTMEYAKENGFSIQVAARKLRYAYFDELCREHKYTRIAIAHNLNDSVETVLLNLSRGTGLKGLTGIKHVNGKVIRPLLFALRSEIEEYANAHNINYREDSSNATTKYKRNFIRHKVLPLLQNLNPSVYQSIALTAANLSESQVLVDRQLEQIRSTLVRGKGNSFLLSLSKLNDVPAAQLFLVEFLADFGFTPSQAREAYNLIHSISGKFIESETHTVFHDREFLIVQPKIRTEDIDIEIYPETESIDEPLKMIFQTFDAIIINIEKDTKVANLDWQKLKFPLRIRHWRPGDRFIPLGMKGFKKVSDFLIDIKLPVADKQKVFVLTSGNDIVWVIGYRIDNRFRIDNETQRVYKVIMLK